MHKSTTLALFLLAAVAASIPGTALATPPQPTYGTAVVDGLYGEWNLATDFFANMYRAGNPNKTLESKAYLRYDCLTHTMYVLVVTEPGVVGTYDPSPTVTTSWVAINSQSNKVVNEESGNDGIPPDFAWVDPGFDANPDHNHGYEASFTIVPGDYNILFHTEIFDVTGQTSASTGFPNTGPALVIECPLVGTEPTTWSQVRALYR